MGQMTNTQGSDYQNKRFSCNGCHLSRYINILSMGEEHNILVLNNSDLSGAIPNRFPSVITILFIDACVEKCSSAHCIHFRPLLFVLGPEGAHSSYLDALKKEPAHN